MPLFRLLSIPRVWLVLFLWLAWGLRLYHLDTMSIWWDESLSWARATSDLPTILANTIQIQNVVTRDLHPPLYFVLLHFALRAFGESEFGLRALSAFVSTLTVAMLYPLVRTLERWNVRTLEGWKVGRLERSMPTLQHPPLLKQPPSGDGVARLTVLFAALSPFYVWYAQEARPYALVLFLSLLALYALLKWLCLPFASTQNPVTFRVWLSPWFALFVVALAATLATHYLSFVLLPFLSATLLLSARETRWRARLLSPYIGLAALAMIGTVVILVLIPREAQALTGSDSAGPGFVPFFIMLRDVWNSFAVGVTANLDQVAWLDGLLLALWLLGVFSTIRVRHRAFRPALFLLAYLFLPAITLQLGSLLRPLYLNSRHLITASPAFYLGLALGVEAIARRLAFDARRLTFDARRLTFDARRLTIPSPPSSVIYVLTALVLASLFGGGAIYSLNNLYFNSAYAKDDHKAWSEFLRERLRPDDYLILVAPQAEKIVRYYAPPGLSWRSLPHLGQTRDWQEFLDRQAVLDAYRRHERVWFLEIHQPVADPKFHINDLMHRFGDAVDIVYFPGISSRLILQQFVYRSAELPNDVSILYPRLIRFGKNLQLLGYNAPAQVEAGGRVAVKLYWRLRKKIPNDFVVSLRVVDEKGTLWGQWDAPPVGNLYPTSKWRPRRIMLDRHDLVVDPGAPPGTYFIELSVYGAADHEPLAAHIADQSSLTAPIRLTPIEVTRPHPPLDPRALLMDYHADVTFGDALRFVGYDLEESRTNPGSDLPLVLYFQVIQSTARRVNGQVELCAPFWQFWNRTRAAAPFALDLAARLPGDIVQARVNVRVPGEAAAGEYALHLRLDGLEPRALGDETAVQTCRRHAYTIGAVWVEPLARSMTIPEIAQPLRARLGEQVELLGYDLRAPQPLRPGDTLKLTLYWRARQTMDTSYTVFTHLINAQDRIFGQNDSPPLNGTRPTTSWAPGEVFADVHEFQVAPDAPPGTYRIEIGLYNALDNTRLPTYDQHGNPIGNRILLTELRVH